jgi:hypothetical protein
MEALGVATSVITAVQISKEILSLCAQYALDVKDAKTGIDRLRNEVATVRDVLKGVQYLVEGEDAPKLPTLNTTTVVIDQCLSELEHLKTLLNPEKSQHPMKRLGSRALRWPFQKNDVNKIIEALQKYKTTLNLAIDIDQR